MKTVDLRKFIEVTTRNNADEYGKVKPELATDDMVFLPTLQEIREFRKNYSNKKLKISDYGICTGGNWSMAYDPKLTVDRKYYTNAWLSDCDEFQSEKYVRYVDSDFGVDTEGVDNLSNGILPMMNLNLKMFEKLWKYNQSHGNEVAYFEQDKDGHMTICFGKYPQICVKKSDKMFEDVFPVDRLEKITKIEEIGQSSNGAKHSARFCKASNFVLRNK